MALKVHLNKVVCFLRSLKGFSNVCISWAPPLRKKKTNAQILSRDLVIGLEKTKSTTVPPKGFMGHSIWHQWLEKKPFYPSAKNGRSTKNQPLIVKRSNHFSAGETNHLNHPTSMSYSTYRWHTTNKLFGRSS